MRRQPSPYDAKEPDSRNDTANDNEGRTPRQHTDHGEDSRYPNRADDKIKRANQATVSAVLICYLDDSGKDPQSSITTLAGYVATDTAWQAFEADVEPWFAEFNVNILHARDLHASDGEFKGWSILKKQAFVSRVC